MLDERYGTQFVCVFVCPLSTRCLEGLYYNSNKSEDLILLFQDFNLQILIKSRDTVLFTVILQFHGCINGSVHYL